MRMLISNRWILWGKIIGPFFSSGEEETKKLSTIIFYNYFQKNWIINSGFLTIPWSMSKNPKNP